MGGSLLRQNNGTGAAIILSLNIILGVHKNDKYLKEQTFIHKNKNNFVVNEEILIIILKFDFTEHMQYREEHFRNGNKLDK